MEIVLGHFRIFRGTMGIDFLLMAYNVRPHKIAVVSDTLQGENIQRME